MILQAAEKVFANEMLYGAPMVKALLQTDLRDLVVSKVAVIEGCVDAGRMAQVNATHLFFTLWAATQTYTDFDVQTCAVPGHNGLTWQDHVEATEHVVSLLLHGCRK